MVVLMLKVIETQKHDFSSGIYPPSFDDADGSR